MLISRELVETSERDLERANFQPNRLKAQLEDGLLVLTGVGKGACVGDRRRVSPSRLQMLIWTVVIVSAFGTIALARAQHDVLTALDVGVPRTIWLLLGIQATSLTGSSLIHDLKTDPCEPVVAGSRVSLNQKMKEVTVSFFIDSIPILCESDGLYTR
jgi:hypothetical protein